MKRLIFNSADRDVVTLLRDLHIRGRTMRACPLYGINNAVYICLEDELYALLVIKYKPKGHPSANLYVSKSTRTLDWFFYHIPNYMFV